MADFTIKLWSEFLEEVEEVSARLQIEVAALSTEISTLTARLDQRFSEPNNGLEAGQISSLSDFFGVQARLTLVETVEAYSKLRVEERLPRAFRDFRNDMTDAARKLPVKGNVSAREFAEALPQVVGVSWKVKFEKLIDRARSIPVRAVALEQLGLDAGLDSLTEGRLYLYHAQAALALLDPWQELRYHAFRQIRGEPAEDERLDRTRKRWKLEFIQRERAGALAVEAMAVSLTRLPQRLTQAIITNSPKSQGSVRHRGQRKRCEAYWGRQRRAIRSLVGAESAILELGNQAVLLARDFAQSADSEHAAVREELLSVLSALREWQVGQPNPIPPPKARLTSAAERGSRWDRALKAQAEALLPLRLETLDPRRPLPGWRAPWRDLEPRKMFLGAVTASGDAAVDAFSGLEISHKAVIREVERAREVVAFGIETAENEPESGRQIAQESITNAISLLEHRSQEIEETGDSVEPGIVMATVSCLYQFHLAFEQGAFSLASHVAREGGYRAFKKATQVLAEWLRQTGEVGWSELRRLNRWLLVRIGWRAPLESGLEPVERWHYLGEDFAIDLKPRHLPLIYARLFRVDPVEDPRFLVGRDVEMGALAEAKGYWETGRQASVLVIGERGSGKTSLLNCATTRLFSNADVVRSRFGERVLTAEGVRGFLATQLQLKGEAEVLESLQSKRRIIILEEVERTFLRVVGGNAGIRELLRIVGATSETNLWVLSMTAAAYRLLNPSQGAGRFFSHRINASSVERDQLKEAILQRHHLSGLRLEFTPPAIRDGIPGWIRKKIGTGESPEAAFFDNLYGLSDGVFRSAFGLWLKDIDRAEGGVLHMARPTAPDYEGLIRGLVQDDLFTLQLMRQHGTLTVEEHARIFDSAIELSRGRMAQLLGREIIELDPKVSGYRVRPEASGLVRSALSGQNLR